MLLGIRSTQRARGCSAVGLVTIRKLEASGITTLQEIAQMKLADFETIGVPTRFAKQIISYSQRGLR